MKTIYSFDDYSIPFRSNVDLTLLPGIKYSGNPIIRRGAPGTHDSRWARLWGGTVIYDQDKFRMWYSGADSIEGWMNCKFRALYAESTDGIEWIKPNLDLVEYKGSRNNNIIDIEYPVEMPAIMVDDSPDVPLEERYKMFSDVHSHIPQPLPFIAVSSDGLRWKTVANPKHRGVYLYKFNDLYHSAFVMYTSELPGGFPGGRVMGVIRSKDWKNWTGEPCLAFHRANYFLNPPDISEQVHTPAGFWNRGNVILGVYGQIHEVQPKPGSKFARLGSGMENVREDLGLFLSNDGLHFREPIPSFKIVNRGMEGQWDGGSIVPANSFVNVGEYTHLYYGGWDNGLCFDTAAGDIGLAFWRRDGFGFVRIRGFEKNAVIQTVPILPDGEDKEIFVNFDIAASSINGCGLNFELVDLNGQVIEGYTSVNCITCIEPGLCQPVRWKNHDTLIRDIKEPVELRIIFISNGDSLPYQKLCSSPLLYCIYIGKKGEVKKVLGKRD